MGINEFTSFFTPELLDDFKCETGEKEGWYKNCKYKFQFELDTDYWYIYDKNTQNTFSQPFEEEPTGYWLAFDYSYTDNEVGWDAYGSVFVEDLTISNLSFVEYIHGYNNTMYEPSQYVKSNIINWIEDSDNLQVTYYVTYFNYNTTFVCYDSHVLKGQLVYFISTCEDESSGDARYLRDQIANFWETFLFY